MPQSDERFTAREIKALREEDSARKEIPERMLSPKDRLEAVRKDLGYFVKNYRQFQANYSELDHELESAFPGFHQDTDGMMRLLDELSAPDGGLADAVILHYLDRYNAAVPRVNRVFDSLKRDQQVAGGPPPCRTQLRRNLGSYRDSEGGNNRLCPRAF